MDEKNAVDTNYSIAGTDPVDDLPYMHGSELQTGKPSVPGDSNHPNPHCHAECSRTSPDRLRDSSMTKPRNSEWPARVLDPLLVLPVNDDDAQGILDEHCSRIWADEQEGISTSETKGEFGKFPTSVNHPAQELPGSWADPTVRRSRGAFCDSPMDRVSARRRTALSAALTSSLHAEPDVSEPLQRCSHRRSSVRTHNRSDARSTASWDSGVITHCPYPAESTYPNNTLFHGETETRSIVAAASLQALSSSTTELAMVNSEVTTKLVEHMTRHYRRNPDSEPTVQPTGTNPFAPKMSPYRDYDLLCSPPLMCRSAYHCHYPYSQAVDPVTGNPVHAGAVCNGQSVDNAGRCMTCIQNTWRPCARHQVKQLQPFGHGWSATRAENKLNKADDGGGHSFLHGPSLPTASDTSSTFDSGISSTYDQLPLTFSQGNTDRGSRSQ